MRTALATFCTVTCLVLGSCGGPSSKLAEPPKPVPPPAPTGPAGPAQPAVAQEAPQGDPRYAMLKPYFRQFLRRPLESKTNIFKSNLAQFAPKVELETEETAVQDEPKTPLEYYDVDSYRLVLIMSGTAVSKALMVDPRGKSYIVQVGTRIGNRGGRVVSISATEVRIEEPARPPVIKALEMPGEELERELQSVQEF